MDKLGDSIRKVLLAGVGAIATTTEKSHELLDDLVKKGELTVEQGKALNEELKHNAKEKIKSATQANTKDKMDKYVADMTPEQIAALKAAIDEKEAADEAVEEGAEEE